MRKLLTGLMLFATGCVSRFAVGTMDEALFVVATQEPIEMVTSWYGPGFHGRLTASGEVYNQWGMTAAHKTLPLGTVAILENPENGRIAKVRINDRGPYIPGRHLDVSMGVAEKLGFKNDGIAKLNVYIVKLPGR